MSDVPAKQKAVRSGDVRSFEMLELNENPANMC